MKQATKWMAAMLLGAASAGAWAQTWPTRQIRLVVGFAPAGAADTVARAMGEAFAKALGQNVVIDNKPGAGSSLAADFVAKSAPDGYTVLIASPSNISVNPALNPKLAYKPSDLQPVTKVTTSPLVIAVNPATQIMSVKELIATAKKAPKELNYATSGNGSAPHLGCALFSQVAGVQMTHIPFKGGGPAMQSLVAGDTQVTCATPPSVLALAQSGRLRALAVTTKERTALFPDLPGMREAGLPDYAIEFWYGLFVPTGTPPAVVRKLFDAAIVAMQQPEVKKALAKDGTDVSISTSPEQFASFLVDDSKFWVRLVKDAGVTAE